MVWDLEIVIIQWNFSHLQAVGKGSSEIAGLPGASQTILTKQCHALNHAALTAASRETHT